jgi:hypothetical protein
MADFSRDMSRFVRNTNLTIKQVKTAVALKLFAAIIMDTPVLTGRLRANWVASTNAADRTTNTGAINPIPAMTETVLGAGDDDVLYLSNSLPYAARIEYEGWSHTKAPQGMVRKNTKRFAAILKEVIR